MTRFPYEGSRYPYPVPYGWFQVGWPEDFPVGKAKPLYYFGKHLVGWRDENGVAHVQDAFCPHLGAHFGHGGTVHGDQIRCPFHGWRFDGAGECTDIPYADRINKKGRIRTYPTIERNGLVLTWYHPNEVEPLWEVPEVPQFNAPHGFDTSTHRVFEVAACWQEIAENGVDLAHFRYVHNTAAVPELDEYHSDGHKATLKSTQKFVTPQGVVEGRIDVDTTGPGFTVTHFSGFVDLYLLGCNTPIDEEHMQLRFTFAVPNMGDADATSSVGKAFAKEVSQQVFEDKMIWEHKAHVVTPALAHTDGPFMQFRRWAAQFYVEPDPALNDAAQTGMYPPPVWFDRFDDKPGGDTASKRLGTPAD